LHAVICTTSIPAMMQVCHDAIMNLSMSGHPGCLQVYAAVA